jgi:hypothetical protein
MDEKKGLDLKEEAWAGDRLNRPHTVCRSARIK